jgi:hypothetical protein
MRSIVIAAIAGVALAPSLMWRPADAQTSLNLTYAGFNYVSYYNGGYENADSLPALVDTGANAAALTLEYGIDVQNSTVYADSSYTDSLTALGATIAEARDRGLSVMVRPLIDFLDASKIGSYGVGDWRSLYNPTNPAAFFASYKTMIVDVAQVAQANGAAVLSIGAELDQLAGPAYLTYWTDIIASVRAVFSGTLTYSADWDDDISPWAGQYGLTAGTGNLATQVSFWNELDYVGIDDYAPLSDAAHPVLADLIAGWTATPTDPISLAVTGNRSLIGYFDAVAAQTGKPLIFTELGYESASDAAQQPSGSSTNIYDPALQANLYAAFFDAWRQSANNSLIGVYVWDWDPNAAEVGPGNGPNFSPQGQPAQSVVTAGFAMRPVNGLMAGTHDFNGDGFSDLAWRNTGGNAALWLMDAVAVLQSTALGAVPTMWSIAGTADFNGDRMSDILWNDANGDISIWFMNGTTVASAAAVATVTSNWTLDGTGDLNGDGIGDLLWRDSNTGTIAAWFMNGSSVASTTSFGAIPSNWTIIGDANGGILWRDTGGDIAIWYVQGGQVAQSAGLGNVPSNFVVQGVGDFNGDGNFDILWRDTNTGTLSIWFLSGTQLQFMAKIGVLTNTWNVAAVGDYNGDGKSDILFLDSAGDLAVWLMNGSTVSSSLAISNVGTTWQVQNVNAN